MGAWGHDHFDNDGAQDLICIIRGAVEKELRKILCIKRFDRTYYEGVIAAAALVAAQGEACGVSFPPVTDSPYRFFDLAEAAQMKIGKILLDESFFKDWNSPEAKFNAVKSLHFRLVHMLQDQAYRASKAASRPRRRKRPRISKINPATGKYKLVTVPNPKKKITKGYADNSSASV